MGADGPGVDPVFDRFIEGAPQRSPRHYPVIVPRPKMDTPTGLFAGACSCKWVSDSLETENGAWSSANQHAAAKNAQLEAEGLL